MTTDQSSWHVEVNRQLAEHGGELVEARRDIDELKEKARNMANELRELRALIERKSWR